MLSLIFLLLVPSVFICFVALPDIDDCADMPCLNGECVDGIAAFQCICNPGFTGMRCESGKGSKNCISVESKVRVVK